MSKLFFDNLIDLSEIDKKIKNIASTPDEREEIRSIIDEIVHHKVMDCILDRLPREHHEEFLIIYHSKPHDEDTLFEYLTKKIGENIKELIKQEIGGLTSDFLEDIMSSKTLKK